MCHLQCSMFEKNETFSKISICMQSIEKLHAKSTYVTHNNSLRRKSDQLAIADESVQQWNRIENHIDLLHIACKLKLHNIEACDFLRLCIHFANSCFYSCDSIWISGRLELWFACTQFKTNISCVLIIDHWLKFNWKVWRMERVSLCNNTHFNVLYTDIRRLVSTKANVMQCVYIYIYMCV